MSDTVTEPLLEMLAHLKRFLGMREILAITRILFSGAIGGPVRLLFRNI